MSAAFSVQYSILDLAHDVFELIKQHGQDGPPLLAGLREPYSRILAADLTRASEISSFRAF